MRIRRKELGLSADDVAAALNVSRATIFRYEKGDIEKVPGNYLAPLEQVLHTNAAYLMGWSDNPSPAEEPSTAPQLLPDERQLLSDYRNFNDEGQEKVRDYVEDLKDSPKYKKCSVPCMEKQA